MGVGASPVPCGNHRHFFVDFLEHSGHVGGLFFALLAELETAFLQHQLEVPELVSSNGVPGEFTAESVKVEGVFVHLHLVKLVEVGAS